MTALGAAHGRPLIGVAAMGTLVVLHLRQSEARAAELKLCLGAGLVGYLADSALVIAGFLDFPEAARLGGPSPLWMVFLWMGFAATLNEAMRSVVERPWAAGVLGFVAGPLSYRGGQAVGALELPGAPAQTLFAVACVVAVVTVSLSALARWLVPEVTS
jgi:hypothetical protein